MDKIYPAEYFSIKGHVVLAMWSGSPRTLGDEVFWLEKSAFMASNMQRAALTAQATAAQRRPHIRFISFAKIPLRSVLRLWFITIAWSTVTSPAALWMNLIRCAKFRSLLWRAVVALKGHTSTMRRNVSLRTTVPATTKARLFSRATPSKRTNWCGKLVHDAKAAYLGDVRAHRGSPCTNPWIVSFYRKK